MNEDYVKIHKPQIGSDSNTQTKKGKKKSISSIEINSNNSRTDLVQHVFNSFVNDIEDAKSRIQQDLLDSIYKNTFDYFNVYYQKRVKSTESNANVLIIKPLNSIFNIIPTIALFTGINIQDYSNLCEKLCLNLKQGLTKNLFVINENNCHNMKTLTYSLFSQLEAINNSDEKMIKKNLYTFRSFFDLVLNDQSKNKTKSIIFIFKQFELISKDIVENFISVVSCYVEKISIFFIIELASQSSVLYEQLNGSAISKLCIKKLYSMPANDYMNNFLTKVFIENLTLFKLSGEILKYLIDVYNNYNFSVSHFIHALKFCLYDHLQNDLLNPMFLYNNKRSEDENSLIIAAYKSELASAESTLKNLIPASTSQNATKTFLKSLNTMQEEWIKYHNQFSLMIQILFEIINSFPTETRGVNDNLKTFSNTTYCDLYVQICNLINTSSKESKKFIDFESFQNLKKLLQLSSSTTFNEIVTKLLKLINNIETNAYNSEFLNDLLKLDDTLKQQLVEQNLIVYNNLSDNEDNAEQEVSPKKSIKRAQSISRKSKPLVDNSNTYQQNDQLSPSKDVMLRRRKTQSNAINNLNLNRNKFIDWLTNQCSRIFNIDYTSSFLYSKYFCYVNMTKMKQHLFVNQRIVIHDALINPFKYLNEKLVSEKTDKDLLPISIIYKIYLECGHMINLFDWLQAFVEKMENCDLDELDERKRKFLQALFFRAITELQFIGYIKQTSRKQDHVVKLTNISYNPDDS